MVVISESGNGSWGSLGLDTMSALLRNRREEGGRKGGDVPALLLYTIENFFVLYTVISDSSSLSEDFSSKFQIFIFFRTYSRIFFSKGVIFKKKIMADVT